MDEIKQNASQLKDSWAKIEQAMIDAPEAWQPHLPYSTPAEIGEVVSTIVHFLDRVRAPSGFAPAFRLGRGFSATALKNALNTAKNLEAGQFNHFPTFLTYLNQVMAALQSLNYFSDADERRQAIESLGGKLAEALALLDTAQTELSEKAKLISKAEDLASSIEEKAETIEMLETQATSTVASLATLKAKAESDAKAITQNEEEIETLKEDLSTEKDKSIKSNDAITAQLAKVTELHDVSDKLEKLIRDLLPDAASAGLAESFARRVQRLEWTKWIWMFVFLGSIAGLIVTAAMILTKGNTPSGEFWQVLLQRLPFTAPMIWLGWFSAIQYGNTVRLQEDYAFKEATAKAFVGYKDHMEHLSNVNIEDTKTAMKLLAARTIEILSHEPLRIYQKSSDDVSPSKMIRDFFFPGKKDPNVS